VKYLKSYNESKKYKPSLDEFISELDKELSNIGFSIRQYVDKTIRKQRLDIGEIIDFKKSTYIYFYVNTLQKDIPVGEEDFYFSIETLRKKCNILLDEDKSEWKCSDEVKDNYDLLCMTILTFLDEKNYGKIKK
jgi:hypothetical protein